MFKMISEKEWELERFDSFAGLGNRLLALFIDAVLFIPVALAIYCIEWALNIRMPSQLYLGLFILYRIICHNKKGATIGKKQTELRVQDYKGKRLNLKQSILHESILILSITIDIGLTIIQNLSAPNEYQLEQGLTVSIDQPTPTWQIAVSLIGSLLILIDGLWIFTNKEKQTLHDKIAKTYCKRK